MEGSTMNELGFIRYTMNEKLHNGWHIGLKSYNGWNVSWEMKYSKGKI